jgi:hypothetical protein
VPAERRRGLGRLGGNDDVVSDLTRRHAPPEVVDPDTPVTAHDFHVAENPITQNLGTPAAIPPSPPPLAPATALPATKAAAFRKRGRPPEGPKESFHVKIAVDVYDFLEQEWREGRRPDGKRYRHRGEYLELLLREVRRQKTGR